MCIYQMESGEKREGGRESRISPIDNLTWFASSFAVARLCEGPVVAVEVDDMPSLGLFS